MSRNKNKVVVLLCAALLALVILPPYVPVIDGILNHYYRLFTNTVTPVNQSVFASLVNETPHPVVYPQSYTVEYNTSYAIYGDYGDNITITESEAVDAAFKHLKDYLPESMTEDFRVVELEDHTFPGVPFVITSYWPRWAMTLIAPSFHADIFVNALSGGVVYTNIWANESQLLEFESFSPESPLTHEHAEEAAKEYLQLLNYTLPPNAMYEGPVRKPAYFYGDDDYYTISFHQVVNGVLVQYGHLRLRIETETGLVSEFVYRWIDINEIPTERVISVETATQAVLDNFTDPSEALVTDIVLTLALTESYASKTPFAMRLAYRIRAVRWEAYLFIVDACTGEILSRDFLMSVSLLDSPYRRVGMVLAVAFFLSLQSYEIAMRRVTKEYTRQKH
jgi:hypothetical protein